MSGASRKSVREHGEQEWSGKRAWKKSVERSVEREVAERERSREWPLLIAQNLLNMAECRSVSHRLR